MARHGRGYPSRLPQFRPLHRDTGGAPPQPPYDVNDLYLVDRAEGGYAGTYDDFYLGKTYTAGSFTAAMVNVRIGGAWVPKPLKRYNGSTWVTVENSRFKYWNGSSWTQVPAP